MSVNYYIRVHNELKFLIFNLIFFLFVVVSVNNITVPDELIFFFRFAHNLTSRSVFTHHDHNNNTNISLVS
jgi:hypothetical protein